MSNDLKNSELIIFGPNNHSKFKIEWLDVDSRIANYVTRLVAEHYGLRAARVRIVDEWGRMSKNYRVDMKDGQSVLVRQNIAINNQETVMSLDKLAIFLADRGIPTPTIVPNKNGNLFTMADGHIWQVFEFIAGDHYRGTKPELLEMAARIGQLHLILKNVDFTINNKSRHHDWNMDQWKEIFKLAKAGENEVDAKVSDCKDFLFEQARLADEYRKKQIEVSIQVIHNDLHPQNTIFEGGRLKALLDFEKAHAAELARDIGKACHRFVRQYVVCQGRPWQETLDGGVRAFFEGYIGVNPVAEKDFREISNLLKDELVSMLAKVLGDHYLRNNSLLVKSGEFEKMLILLRESLILEEYLRF